MILSYPDAHLICINDLSSLTVCLNLSICQHAFTHVCIATCNLSAYTFVMCKIKATYLLYLLSQQPVPSPNWAIMPVVVLTVATLMQNSASSLMVARTVADAHCTYPRRYGQPELAWVAGYITGWFVV